MIDLYRLGDQGGAVLVSLQFRSEGYFFLVTMVLSPHVTDEFHFDSLLNCLCFYYLLVLCV